MNIVVTGASGFLGSSLAKKLVSHDHPTLCVSRNTPNPLEAIIDFEPDVVVHCAWKGGNSYTDVSSLSQLDNVYDGLELLHALANLPKKPKFVGFGSFAEYGDLTNIAREDDQENPTNLYGLSKLTFKNSSKLFCEQASINWSWIRPCYVYGPGDVQTRLIPSTILKLLNQETVILDSCNKVIDYIFIDDFTHFAYEVITQPADGVYNICSGQQYSLRSVIQTVAKLLDAEDRVIFRESELRKLTSAIVCGSNLKVSLISPIKPLTPLYDGLSRTIDYIQSTQYQTDF